MDNHSITDVLPIFAGVDNIKNRFPIFEHAFFMSGFLHVSDGRLYFMSPSSNFGNPVELEGKGLHMDTISDMRNNPGDYGKLETVFWDIKLVNGSWQDMSGSPLSLPPVGDWCAECYTTKEEDPYFESFFNRKAANFHRACLDLSLLHRLLSCFGHRAAISTPVLRFFSNEGATIPDGVSSDIPLTPIEVRLRADEYKEAGLIMPWAF